MCLWVFLHGAYGGRRGQGITLALLFFLIQLVLNALWSYLFFGIHRPDWALFEIVILWVGILMTVVAFFKLDRPTGALLLPYLVWVSFAAYLNYSFVQLNHF